MNFKQEELSKRFIDIILKEFPELEFIKITESPEDPSDSWVHFWVPDDEDRMLEISHFAGGVTNDILMEYGWFFIIYQHPRKMAKAA